MGMYEVEVEGNYTTIVAVVAESHVMATQAALRTFEQDIDVVTNMGARPWARTSIVAVNEVEKEDY